MSRNVPTRVFFLLFALFLLGLALNVLAFVDLHWMHRVLENRDREQSVGDGQVSTKTVDSGGGIGYVAPMSAFLTFFREKTGQELP